jgi:hypothetical protein
VHTVAAASVWRKGWCPTSSAVSNVPSQSRCPLCGSRISAAHLPAHMPHMPHASSGVRVTRATGIRARSPHGRCRTPRYVLPVRLGFTCAGLGTVAACTFAGGCGYRCADVGCNFEFVCVMMEVGGRGWKCCTAGWKEGLFAAAAAAAAEKFAAVSAVRSLPAACTTCCTSACDCAGLSESFAVLKTKGF